MWGKSIRTRLWSYNTDPNVTSLHREMYPHDQPVFGRTLDHNALGIGGIVKDLTGKHSIPSFSLFIDHADDPVRFEVAASIKRIIDHDPVAMSVSLIS